jgi:steroid delta-isomerase-like uncharacterized protein
MTCSCAHAASNNNKNDVMLWYDAFNTKDPALVDKILGAKWDDVPPAPGQAPGRQGAKAILVELTTAFPDLKLTVKDILQDGDKVVVRSEITGTQSGPFMGFPAKNRKIAIQAIDIHQFEQGKIVRSWHTEDWMTALRQMEAFQP